MNIIALVIVVFLTNGQPILEAYTLPEGAKCDAETAMRYARDYQNTFPDTPIQETVLWRCDPVTSPGPGPAMRPTLFQGQTEALSQEAWAREALK